MNQLRIKLFADGARLEVIARMAATPVIKGFTTNPTLMRKAGVTDYHAFAREALALVRDRPISFEVFSDDFDEMEQQAFEIASWADNVFVKIPVTNTRGEFSGQLLRRLSSRGVQLNVTALLTAEQVTRVAECLEVGTRNFVSVFAGRIADAGCDPVPIIEESLTQLVPLPFTELIWASPREVFNVVQADTVGCHIITATDDVLAKLPILGKDLDEFSLETVQMFRRDAVAAGYTIELSKSTSPRKRTKTRPAAAR